MHTKRINGEEFVMGELSKLPNIGAVAEELLSGVGITTPEELRQAGSKQAFLRIREERDPGACLSMLCGLEGAIRGVRWHDLPAGIKDDLRAFYRSLRL